MRNHVSAQKSKIDLDWSNLGQFDLNKKHNDLF